MKELIKQGLVTAATTLLLATSVNAAPIQTISVSGVIVEENSLGTLGVNVGKNFTYNATYQLDRSLAVDTWTNSNGDVHYDLNDGGATFHSSACIQDFYCYDTNFVSFEFDDNLVENWDDIPFIIPSRDLTNGEPLDAIVLGFFDPLLPDETEFWLTLLFEADLFDSNDESTLPELINLDGFIGGVGEFAQWDPEADDWGAWAQFRADTVNISTVPVPAAVWLFGSGLLGLIGIARRKKA